MSLTLEQKIIISDNRLDLRLTSDYDDLIRVDEPYAMNALSISRELVDIFGMARKDLLKDLEKTA